jgi:hypothetical protein
MKAPDVPVTWLVRSVIPCPPKLTEVGVTADAPVDTPTSR